MADPIGMEKLRAAIESAERVRNPKPSVTQRLARLKRKLAELDSTTREGI